MALGMTDFLVNWLANAPGTAAPYAFAALGLIIFRAFRSFEPDRRRTDAGGRRRRPGSQPDFGRSPPDRAADRDAGGEPGVAVVRGPGRDPAGQSGDRGPGYRVLLSGPDRPDRYACELAEPSDRRARQDRDLAAFGDSRDRADPVRSGPDRLPRDSDFLRGFAVPAEVDAGTEAARGG